MTYDSGGIQENCRFKDFARMHDAEGERADRNDVHADDSVFYIETRNEELFTIERCKERAEDGCGRAGITDDKKRSSRASARHETQGVARNKRPRSNVRALDDREFRTLCGVLVCHGGTFLFVGLAGSLAGNRRASAGQREVTGRACRRSAGGREQAAGVTVFWREWCARETERGRQRPGMAKQSRKRGDVKRGEQLGVWFPNWSFINWDFSPSP